MMTTAPVQVEDRVNRVALRKLREAAGIRPVDMSRRLGITRHRYSHYEAGRRPFPLPLIVAIAETLGCRVDDLIARQ